MTPERFEQIVDEVFDRCRATLVDRAKMYARGDRLSNFKRAARIRHKTYVEALDGMGIKQVTALFDYIDDAGAMRIHTREEWLEKMVDTINYYGPLLITLLKDVGHFAKDELPNTIEPVRSVPIHLGHNVSGPTAPKPKDQ